MHIGDYVSGLAQACGLHSATSLGADHAIGAMCGSLTDAASIALVAVTVMAVLWQGYRAGLSGGALRWAAESLTDALALHATATQPHLGCRWHRGADGRLLMEWRSKN